MDSTSSRANNDPESNTWPLLSSSARHTKHSANSRPQEQHMTPRKYFWRQHLAALLGNIPSFNVGFALFWTAPAVPILVGQVQDPQPLRLSLEEASWASAVLPLATLVGALAAGPLADRVGRKGALLAGTVPSLLGWLLLTFGASSLWLLLVSRIIIGVSCGAVSGPVTLYCEEMADVRIRGALGTYHFLIASVGSAFVYGMGVVLPYFWLNAVALVPPLLFLVTFWWMPESPAYLAMRGRHKEAHHALMWFKGPDVDCDRELETLLASKSQRSSSEGSPSRSFLALFSRRPWRSNALRSVAILMMMAFLQQMTGIMLFCFYTVQMFQELGGSIPSHLSSFFLGLGNCLAAFLSIVVVDRLGRRVLLIIPSVVMSVCLIVLAVYTQFNTKHLDLEGWKWLPLALLLIYGFMYNLGLGPVSWFLMAEMVPMYAKAWGCPAVICMNRICVFIMAKEAPRLVELIGQVPTYLVFSVFCLIAAIYVKLFIPETKGKSKVDILKEIGGVDP